MTAIWLLIAAPLCSPGAPIDDQRRMPSVCGFARLATPVNPSEAYGIFFSFHTCDDAAAIVNNSPKEPRVRCVYWQGKLP